MCLIPDPLAPKLRDGTIRWKLMRQSERGEKGVRQTNHGTSLQYVGCELKADCGPTDQGYVEGKHGIHVCADEASFHKLHVLYQEGHGPHIHFAKVEVECFDHYASGVFDDNAVSSNHETWGRVVIRSITLLNRTPNINYKFGY